MTSLLKLCSNDYKSMQQYTGSGPMTVKGEGLGPKAVYGQKGEAGIASFKCR